LKISCVTVLPATSTVWNAGNLLLFAVSWAALPFSAEQPVARKMLENATIDSNRILNSLCIVIPPLTHHPEYYISCYIIQFQASKYLHQKEKAMHLFAKMQKRTFLL
jgi:hypothetical protein